MKSKQKEKDVFDVARDMVTKLRSQVGEPNSINGKMYTKMVHTLLVVRAINRLAAAVERSTKALNEANKIALIPE